MPDQAGRRGRPPLREREPARPEQCRYAGEHGGPVLAGYCPACGWKPPCDSGPLCPQHLAEMTRAERLLNDHGYAVTAPAPSP